jgi:hypothetical protein
MFAAIRAMKISALVLDHVAGENVDSERSVTKPYGSIYKVNGAQGGVFELRREKSTGGPVGHLALYDLKRNMRAAMAPIGLRIEYEGSDAPTAIRINREDVTSPDLTRVLSLADRMETALRENITAMDPKELADALGMNERNDPQQIRNALNQWKDRRFRKLSDGRWGLASHAA